MLLCLVPMEAYNWEVLIAVLDGCGEIWMDTGRVRSFTMDSRLWPPASRPGRTPAILCAISQNATERGALPVRRCYQTGDGTSFSGVHHEELEQILQRRTDSARCLSGSHRGATQPDRVIPAHCASTGQATQPRGGSAGMDRTLRRDLRRGQRREALMRLPRVL